MNLMLDIVTVTLSTITDVFPIVAILFFFQWFVLKQPIANLPKVVIGFGYVLIGLSLFLVGLDKALFPLGNLMAKQLTDPSFITGGLTLAGTTLAWHDYKWVYLFSFAIGFATTLAEPALIAVAMKAQDVSGGAISIWGLRIAVGLGVAIGIALGAFRIVTGIPLHYFIIAGYLVVVVQTLFAPRLIIALAYDSGGVTTSTVTVPLVTALGLGLASTVPGRSAVIDGFGLIAFASLFPIITVLGYAQISEWRAKQAKTHDKRG